MPEPSNPRGVLFVTSLNTHSFKQVSCNESFLKCKDERKRENTSVCGRTHQYSDNLKAVLFKLEDILMARVFLMDCLIFLRVPYLHLIVPMITTTSFCSNSSGVGAIMRSNFISNVIMVL